MEDVETPTAALRKRTRASKPKVRTGCLTWIRRVKCGEEKPACERCSSTGRTCDGYDKQAPPRPPRQSAVADIQLQNAPPRTAIIGTARGWPQCRLPTLVQVEDIRLLRHLVADITGTADERRFFHRFRTSVAADGLTTHVANRTKFWDEQAPAVGHENSAVKHALVALGASYYAFLLRRRGSTNHDATKGLEIFIMQQYNKAITELHTATVAIKDNPIRHLEIILFCCLTFICIDNLRGDSWGALTHLVNGLRIIESELPYSLLAQLRGPPGIATTPIPPEVVHPNRHGLFGVGGNAQPSPFLLNILVLFSRCEVSAALFASNIRPIMILKLFCPTQEKPSVPEQTCLTPEPSPPPAPASPSSDTDSLFNFPPIGPTAPLSYTRFDHAHFHLTILAREIYALAYAVQSRRGDDSFWGPSLLPRGPKSNNTRGSTPTFPHMMPSPSSQATLAQYAVLQSRLAQMDRAFVPFVSGRLAPPPGTKHWRSVRLNLLHMRCCAIHLKTLMFRRGAGCIAHPESEDYKFSTANNRESSSPSPTPSDETTGTDVSHESQDTRRDQIILSFQSDFAYLITIAEEVQGTMASRIQQTHPTPYHQAPLLVTPSSDSTTTSLAPGAPRPPQLAPKPVLQSNTPPLNPTDPDAAQFTVDLGVISPMYLTALHVKDRSLRARALAVMRSVGTLEGFWDGVVLADLLEKIFAATDDKITPPPSEGSDGSREVSPDHNGDVDDVNKSRMENIDWDRLIDGLGQTISGGTAILGLSDRLQGLKL